MRRNLSNEKLYTYFNISEGTYNKNRRKIGIDYIWLYNKFYDAKTLRERKDALYSLKDKFDEDFLDTVWEAYVEKYEYEEHVKLVKQNKKINRELL